MAALGGDHIELRAEKEPARTLNSVPFDSAIVHVGECLKNTVVLFLDLALGVVAIQNGVTRRRALIQAATLLDQTPLLFRSSYRSKVVYDVEGSVLAGGAFQMLHGL